MTRKQIASDLLSSHIWVNLFNLEKVIVPISVVREVDTLGILDQYKNLIVLQS